MLGNTRQEKERRTVKDYIESLNSWKTSNMSNINFSNEVNNSLAIQIKL